MNGLDHKVMTLTQSVSYHFRGDSSNAETHQSRRVLTFQRRKQVKPIRLKNPVLQAICQSTSLGRNSGALYLPLEELSQYPPEQVLEGLESAPLVCIDDLQLVSGREDWHVPLFNLFNNCRDTGCRLMIASHLPADQLDIKLEDLLSRLKSGVSLHLQNYKDADQRRLLQYRSNRRGLYLSDEVALFLLNRLPRDTHALMEALDILDKASLREQRRLTTPFVKEALGL